MILAQRRWLYSAAAILLFSAAAVLIVSAGLPDRAEYVRVGVIGGELVAPVVGALAPPFTLPNADGQTITLVDGESRATVINFWATWCVPCEVEMPALQALYERYEGRGLRVVGVNLGEPAAAVRAWEDRLALTFPLVLDADGRTAADYRLRGQPTTVIVAADGRIASIVYGPADLAALERLITPLLDD